MIQPDQGTKASGNGGGTKYRNVSFHASRISDNYYQVILIDKGGNIQDAIDVAYKAYDQILSLNKGKDSNRFYVWVETSGTGPPSVWKT